MISYDTTTVTRRVDVAMTVAVIPAVAANTLLHIVSIHSNKAVATVTLPGSVTQLLQ